MELITENMLLTSGLLALIIIALVFSYLVKQKNQRVTEGLHELDVPFQGESKIFGQDEESEVSTKPRAEDILEQFDELVLRKKIYKLLVLEKIYLQQGLTVGDFAKNLGVQARIVTQIFGELYGHTFKELINMYRVEYAKERIEEGFLDHFTMEALGQKAGFSSRTTFFNVFKKEIGVCPSEFWKNYLTQAA